MIACEQQPREQHMTAYAEILYEHDGAAAVITLNRPNTLNALTDLTQAEVASRPGRFRTQPGRRRHGAHRSRTRILLRRRHERARRDERRRQNGSAPRTTTLRRIPATRTATPTTKRRRRIFWGCASRSWRPSTAPARAWASATPPSATCASWIAPPSSSRRSRRAA